MRKIAAVRQVVRLKAEHIPSYKVEKGIIWLTPLRRNRKGTNNFQELPSSRFKNWHRFCPRVHLSSWISRPFMVGLAHSTQPMQHLKQREDHFFVAWRFTWRLRESGSILYLLDWYQPRLANIMTIPSNGRRCWMGYLPASP